MTWQNEILSVVDSGASDAIGPLALAALSAFGGAALSAVAGLVGYTVQQKQEQKRWLRDRQLEAFINYLDRERQLDDLKSEFGDWVERIEIARKANVSRKEFTRLLRESEVVQQDLKAKSDAMLGNSSHFLLLFPSDIGETLRMIERAEKKDDLKSVEMAKGRLLLQMRAALGVNKLSLRIRFLLHLMRWSSRRKAAKDARNASSQVSD